MEKLSSGRELQWGAQTTGRCPKTHPRLKKKTKNGDEDQQEQKRD